TAFGLYEYKEGKKENLAMPLWNWGVLRGAISSKICFGRCSITSFASLWQQVRFTVLVFCSPQ
ncbi:MAG: hypothetical protein J6R89_05270, partial [Clostridia bacterium]|nr:hypothetical protein [Clostridia bacterium]